MSSNRLVLRAKIGSISALRKFLNTSMPCSRISSDGLTANIYSAASSVFSQEELLVSAQTKDFLHLSVPLWPQYCCAHRAYFSTTQIEVQTRAMIMHQDLTGVFDGSNLIMLQGITFAREAG